MKLWAKTVGLYKILAISQIASLLNYFCGDEKVNLPTLAGGIHFVETPVTFLLATVIPTCVYFNRAKLAFPESRETKRILVLVELLLVPIMITITACLLCITEIPARIPATYFELSLFFGLVSQFIFCFKPKFAAFASMFCFLCAQLSGLQFSDQVLNWAGA